MGCNCGKGKSKPINNLNVPSYVDLAIDIFNEIKDISYENITEDQFNEMYRIYNMIYPNSKGIPDKKELPEIIQKITQYKVKR